MTSKVSNNMAIAAGVLGFILIACGLGCAIAGFVWTSFGQGAHGIWSGMFMLVTGTLGAVILFTKNKAVMVFFLVFCILDMIVNIIQAIVAAILAAIVQILKDALDGNRCTEFPNGQCYCIYTRGHSDVANANLEFGCDDINTMVAVLRAVTAFSVIGILATFTGSIIGCIGACCDRGQQQPGVVVIQQGQHVQPQMQTTMIQTFHQPPPPPQQYPMNDVEIGQMNTVAT